MVTTCKDPATGYGRPGHGDCPAYWAACPDCEWEREYATGREAVVRAAQHAAREHPTCAICGERDAVWTAWWEREWNTAAHAWEDVNVGRPLCIDCAGASGRRTF